MAAKCNVSQSSRAPIKLQVDPYYCMITQLLENLSLIHLDYKYISNVLTFCKDRQQQQGEHLKHVCTNEKLSPSKKRQCVCVLHTNDLYRRKLSNKPLHHLIYKKMCEQQIISGTALQIHPDLTEFSIGFIVFGFMNEKQVVINIKQEYIYMYILLHMKYIAQHYI